MGAAIGQISGEYRDMVTLSSELTRDRLIERSMAIATDNAVANGAERSSIRVIEKSVDPVPYVGEKGNVVVVYVKVVGDLQQDCEDIPKVVVGADQQQDNEDKPVHIIERKDNPYWPYENEEVLQLDKNFGLQEPAIS